MTLAAAIVLVGCSGTASEPAPTTTTTTAAAPAPCGEVYADGVTTGEATDNVECTRDGEVFVPGTATSQCADGRVLMWNDEGWGFVGEPWSRHPADGPYVPPLDARDACGA